MHNPRLKRRLHPHTQLWRGLARLDSRSPAKKSSQNAGHFPHWEQPLRAWAYNLGNFMRTLPMPETAEPWSLTGLIEKLIKIGAKVASHGRYVTFRMAEVAVPRQMFAEITSLIARLQAPPAPNDSGGVR